MKKRALAIFSAFMIAVNTLTPGLVPSKAAAENISENASGFNVAFKKADEEGNYLDGASFNLAIDNEAITEGETIEGNKSLRLATEDYGLQEDNLDGGNEDPGNQEMPENNLEPTGPGNRSVKISKKEVGGGFLPGAKLKLEKIKALKSDVDTSFNAINWTSGDNSYELNLVPGFYRLSETKAPSGYIQANPIEFEVGPEGSLQDKIIYQGYARMQEYDKEDYLFDPLYIRPLGSKEGGIVVYCFNKTKSTPPDKDSSTNKTHTRLSGTAENFTNLTTKDKARLTGDALINAVKKVIYNGYPNDASGIQGKYGLTDGQFRYITQEAVWYYTDKGNAQLPEKTTRDVYISDDAKKAYKDLLNSELSPANISLDIYEGDDKNYQNLLSTRFANSDEIVMENEKNPRAIKVSKVQTGGFLELEGAELRLVKGSDIDSNIIKTWTTTKSPEFFNLEPASYTLFEIKAPEGYKLAKPIQFFVNQNGTISIPNKEGEFVEQAELTVKMEDELEKAKVTFSKVDIAGNEIAGAKIQIKNKNGKNVEEWESEEGKDKIISLEPGEYTFHEEAAPEGYLDVTDFTFTIDQDGDVKIIENTNGDAVKEENNKITVTDKAHPDYKPIEKEVAFSKIEVNGSKELEGASLKVEKLKEDGSVEKEIENWISDKMAKTIKLSEGVYKMTEDQAPAGYEKAESIIFRITKDGKLEVKENDAWKTREDSTIQMEDQKSPQAPEEKLSITIHKYGSDNLKAELEGAGLSIVPEDDNLESIKFETSKKAKIVELGQGNYKLQELVSPNLYKKAAPILFKVLKTDTGLKLQIKEGDDFVDVEKNEITMIDEKYPDAFTGELKTSVRVKEGQEELRGTSDKEVILQTAEADKEVEIVDDITYSGLVPGEKYSLSTKLMKVYEDGTSTLFVNEVITEQLANENGEGTWTAELGKVKLNPGEKYVIFEKATSETSIEYIEDGKIVNKQHLVSHENPNDKAQTIIVKKPEIPKEPEKNEGPGTNEEPKEPENPKEPQVPNLPEEPKESEEPKEPESSEEPQVPEGPKESEEPKIPEAPEKPKEPQAPEVPKEPQEPGTPEEPKIPQTPEEPKEPQVPEVPKEPQEPGKPEEPKTPQTPEDPKKPQVPEEPKSPEEPKKPDFPKKPESPKKPQLPETQEKPDLPEQKIIKEVSFSKTEVNSSKELVGAQLKVVIGENPDGILVKERTSGPYQMKLSLEEGSYTMVETMAPSGYKIAESITFRVTKEGRVEIKEKDGSYKTLEDSTVRMEDAKISENQEKPKNPENSGKSDKTEESGKSNIWDKNHKSEKSDKNKEIDKSDKKDRQENKDKSENTGKVINIEKSEKSERSRNIERNGKTNDKRAPKTGVKTNIGLYACLIFVSATMLFVLKKVK